MILIKKKLLLTFFCFILVSLFLIISFSSQISGKEIDWENFKQESLQQLKQTPENAVVRFEYAISLANLGQVEESYEQFDILGEEKTREQSRKEIEEHLNTIKNNIILKYNYYAFLAVVDKNYQESIEYFYELIALEPENVWIYNYLAASYYELEEYENAKVILDEALDLKDNSYSHLLYGLIYMEEGKYFRALRAFNRSGKLFDILEDFF